MNIRGLRWPSIVAGITVLVAVILYLVQPIKLVGGNFDPRPPAPFQEASLSPAARALIEAAYNDIPDRAPADYHGHLITLGQDSSGYINARMLGWASPFDRVKALVYMSAGGITDEKRADGAYVDRFVALAKAQPRQGTYALLGFDQFYTPDHVAHRQDSEFYVPNDYVMEVAARHPDVFRAVMSVHPHRADALEQLEYWAGRGIRMVKWLPNAQGINPADEKLDRYYQKLIELKLTLLTHVGEEQAVKSDKHQRFGNPLLFRRALGLGVRIIMAHCASLGEVEDLDGGGGKMPAYRAFLRLMDEPAFEGNLFGEISAMTQFNRLPEPIIAMLNRPDLHHRLVNGSDYPLPAVNILINLQSLVEHGLIAGEAVDPLRETYHYNPLLFDFVLKRTIASPDSGRRFPAQVFLAHPQLPL